LYPAKTNSGGGGGRREWGVARKGGPPSTSETKRGVKHELVGGKITDSKKEKGKSNASLAGTNKTGGYPQWQNICWRTWERRGGGRRMVS